MFERAKETIELEAEVVEGQLVLHLPVGVETAVQVQNNEILIGNYRIIIHLKDRRQNDTL